MEVLDVGCGIGGPARTLAAEFGCRVVGLDLTAEFCRAAEMLTDRLGLAERVRFRHGDAAAMPLEDCSFDAVWSQNTLMNIEDKGRVFSEVRRVLRPGGRFAFETVLAGTGSEIHFPVFWASSPRLNHLVSPAAIRSLLAAAGLTEIAWEETTAAVVALARKRIAVYDREGPGPLGLSVIVPDDVEVKMRNSLRNCEEGRTAAVQAVYARAGRK